MMEIEERQTVVDEEQLRILSVVYFVEAGMSAVFSLFGILYMFMGAFMMRAMQQAPQSQQGPPPEFFGWMFGLIGLFMFVLMMTLGVLKLFAGLRLKQRRSRVFCMVVAAVSCIAIPYGTLLGIFTFMVLLRPSVVKLFEESNS